MNRKKLVMVGLATTLGTGLFLACFVFLFLYKNHFGAVSMSYADTVAKVVDNDDLINDFNHSFQVRANFISYFGRFNRDPIWNSVAVAQDRYEVTI
jgi:hypothetical protein